MTTTPPEVPKLPIRPATPPAAVPGFSTPAPAAPGLTPGPARAASTPAALKSVKPSEHVVAGTGLWTVIAVFALLATFIVLGLATWGIGLLIVWIGSVLSNRKLSGTLRGGALRVGPKQFPEIHERVTAVAGAMGITKLPEVYILESNTQNAFAMKHGKKNRIVLVDDMVFGAGLTGNDQVLTWIIAHELAHVALGHTGAIRGSMRSLVPPLSRLDELTCDRVATAVVNDSDAVRDALTLLLVGPQLFSRVNQRALKEQADEFMKTSKGERKSAESRSSHPLLLHRYAKVSEVLRAPRPVRPTSPQVQPTQV